MAEMGITIWTSNFYSNHSHTFIFYLLNGFIINQNVSDGYELSNLRHQIHDLTGHSIHGTIPYYDSFNIQTYVENFPHIIDISKLGFEDI